MRYLEVKVWVLLVGLLVGSTATVSAQEERQPRIPREDVEGLMEAYVISKLQDGLKLSDQQFAEMVVAQKKLVEHRRSFRGDRAGVLAQLRQLLGSPDAPEEEIASLLDRLNGIQEEFHSQQLADYEAIDKILDVRQRARYRILEQEIQRRFQQMVREVRGRREPRRP